MAVLLDKIKEKRELFKNDAFGKYIENSTSKTTVNGTVVEKKFSWYKRVLGLL